MSLKKSSLFLYDLILPHLFSLIWGKLTLFYHIIGTFYYIFTSISTPAGISKCIKLSMVFWVGSTISMTLLWVFISNASLAFLSVCGDFKTVILSVFVGRGIGPTILAPVLKAVSNRDSQVLSSTR